MTTPSLPANYRYTNQYNLHAFAKIQETTKKIGSFTEVADVDEILNYAPQSLNKIILAQEIDKRKIFEKIPTIIDKTIKIQPLKSSIDSQSRATIKAGEVTPTCFRNLSNKPKNNLENIYVMQCAHFAAIDPKGKNPIDIVGTADIKPNNLVIRSAAIDTADKAQQMDAILRQSQSTTQSFVSKIQRVVSHQLNSPETESDLIRNQHRELTGLNDQNASYEIVHLNTPSNVLYEYTKYICEEIRGIPYIGEFLSKLIEGTFLYGEKVSRRQNLEGLARMSSWLQEDMIAFNDTHAEQILVPKLTIDLETLTNLHACIAANDLDNLKIHRKSIKQELKSYYTALNNLSHKLSKKCNRGQTNYQNIYEKITLMKMILGDQLNIPGESLDRGCLHMTIQLLNQRLGAVSLMNCLSGLDRTGYLFAVKTAMMQMEMTPQKEDSPPYNLFDMIVNWEKYTTRFNQLEQSFADTPNDENAEIGQANPKFIDPFDDESTQMYLQIKRFRKLVYKNLRTVGLDITARSTGVFGYKWHTGFFTANRIPLNFLPQTVKISKKSVDGQEASKIERVKLVDYDETGKPIGLTKDGQALLIKDSSLRGS